MTDLRTRLNEKIQTKPLLMHEFYTRWQAGELSREEMQGYAKEYYPFEQEFPRFLSALHAKCESPEMRAALLENLMHEVSGDENHPELWLRFAEGMGVERDEVNSHFHSDETEHLLRVFRKHAMSPNPIDGIAALYAYEKQQPEVARTKQEGLKKFYGVKDEETVKFFKAHEHYDVQHAETEINILSQLCKTEADEERAEKVVGETLDALYEFLDGVQKRYRKVAA